MSVGSFSDTHMEVTQGNGKVIGISAGVMTAGIASNQQDGGNYESGPNQEQN